MKFVTVRIHFQLSDVFGLLSSRNFATMATWRNDFSSLWINVMKPDWNGVRLCFLKTCLPNSFSKFFLVIVYNVWCNAWQANLFNTKLWLCHSQVISLIPNNNNFIEKQRNTSNIHKKIKTRDWFFKKWTRKPRHSHFETYLEKKGF